MGSCCSACCPCICGAKAKDPDAAKKARKARKKAAKYKAEHAQDAVMCGCLCAGYDKEDASQFYIDVENKVFDTRLIGYDKYGNLRYGIPEHDRHGEMNEVMAVDSTDRDHHHYWYLMDACWLQEWLLYVHGDENVTPMPGPVYNHRLVMKSQKPEDNGKWVAKPNLVMEGNNHIGDYRRVSRHTWELFASMYPNSGPVIKAKYPMIKQQTIAEDIEREKAELEAAKANMTPLEKEAAIAKEKTKGHVSALDNTHNKKVRDENKKTGTSDTETNEDEEKDVYAESGKYPCDIWEIIWTGDEAIYSLQKDKSSMRTANPGDLLKGDKHNRHASKYSKQSLGGDSLGVTNAAAKSTSTSLSTTDPIPAKKATASFYNKYSNDDDEGEGDVDDDMKNIL